MNTNKKQKAKKPSNMLNNNKSKPNTRTTTLVSFVTKEGAVVSPKGRYTTYNTNTPNTFSTDLRSSISHVQLNSRLTTLSQGNNPIESIIKVKEEISSLKGRNQELFDENISLEEQLTHCKTQMQILQDKYDTLKNNNIIKENSPHIHYENLLIQSKKILENFVDITEILALQPKSGIRDSARINNDNISFSIDVYEQSINNDDDRRTCILEQIQSIILFKLKIFYNQFGIDTELLKDRVKNWNVNATKDKDNSNSVSFSNISQIKSKAQNAKSPYSNSSSEIINTSSNLVVPLSPRFYGNEESDFCKSMNESEIDELNENGEGQPNRYSFTTEEAKIHFASTFKSIPSGIHYQDQDQEHERDEKEDEKDKELINEVQNKLIDSFKQLKSDTKNNENEKDKENEEEHKLNCWNNQIEISFEGNTLL